MLTLNLDSCYGCGLCATVCKDAIKIVENQKGFLIPQIDKEKCTNCGKCERVCPVLNKPIKEKYDTECYGAFSKSSTLKKNASSGAIFPLMAKKIIAEDGVVFGAAFRDDFQVLKHTGAKCEEELKPLFESKYLQSAFSQVYLQIESILKSDSITPVLVSGTPCQISALKLFLGKEYENLYTVDLVCHGVSSPKLWRKYLKEFSSNITEVSFRNKDNGWNKFNMKIGFEIGENYKRPFWEDNYMKLFLANLSLRECCFKCGYKGENRCGDITLGDLWGVENFPEIENDDTGITLVTVNSIKGKTLFESIKNEVIFTQIDEEKAFQYNPTATQSVQKPENYDDFFANMDKYSVKELSRKYLLKKSIKDKLKKYKIIRLLLKLKYKIKATG